MEITVDSVTNNSLETLTRRVLGVVSDLGKRYQEADTEEKRDRWFLKTENLLEFHRGSEEISLKAQAMILLMIQEIWQERPEEFRKQYKGDFWTYAEDKTGKMRSTLENHLRAVRTFFVDKVVPPAPGVQIPERTTGGSVKTDSSGSPLYTTIPWNPATVPMSKLVAATARAKAGTLTNAQWGMLADEKCSWEHFQVALSGGEGGGGNNGIHYLLAGDFLIAKEGEQEAYIGNLSLPHDEPEALIPGSVTLRERALRRLALLLNIKTDEQALREAEYRNGLSVYNPLNNKD